MQLATANAQAVIRSSMRKNLVITLRPPVVASKFRFAGLCRHASSDVANQESNPKSDFPRLRFDLPRHDTKVSKSGSADALFQDLIEGIRRKRAECDLDDMRSTKIDKLQQDEIELTRKIFARADPDRDLTTEVAYESHGIDPYWSPFNELREVKEQVSAEFDEYSKYADVAEARRQRIQIRKSLKRATQIYNPYSQEFRHWHGREKGGDQPPKPFRIAEQYWERTPLQERLRKERITWRDVDIIQHFIADNGYILPRRTTTLSRKQQQKLVRAVRTAQHMSMLPYRWRLQDYQAMPLTDPIQWMVDRLTERCIKKGDRRANVMLKVLIERYPSLSYKQYLAHKAKEPDSDDESVETA